MKICVLLLGFAPVVCYGQNFCERAAPVPNTTTHLDVSGEGALSLFKGLVGRLPPAEARAQAHAKYVQDQVLSKFPNASQLAIRQQELAYTCQILQGSNLSPERKISILQKVGEGIDIANRNTSKPQKRASSSLKTKAKQVKPGALNSDRDDIRATTPVPGSKPESSTGNVTVQGDKNSCIGIGQICPKYFVEARPAPAARILSRGEDENLLRQQAQYGNPGQKVYDFVIYVKSRFDSPTFDIEFDRYCTVVKVSLGKVQGGFRLEENVDHEIFNLADNHVSLHLDVPLSASQYVVLGCRTLSAEPLKAISINGVTG